jgi:hypothetical protein
MFEGTPVTKCLNKSFLDQVLGFSCISAKAQSERVKQPTLLVDQARHRFSRILWPW